MKLSKIDSWKEESLSTDHPLAVCSFDWVHTELVDHVDVPIGAHVVIGCPSEEYITLEVWEEVIETNSAPIEGHLGLQISQELEIKVLGTRIRSASWRPIRVKNFDDDKQYLLVRPDELKVIELEGAQLTLEEQIKLYRVINGLGKDLRGLNLSDCKLPFDLTGVDLSESYFKNVDFTGDLSGANFSGCSLEYCELKGLNLEGADFSNSRLKDVDFSASSLRGARFVDAELQEPAFLTCPLEGVVFTRASFNGGDFSCALCEGVDFSGLEYSYSESESDCLNGYLDEPRLLFCWADLRGAKFDGLSLNHAQFTGADLKGASFEGCDLSSEEADYRDCSSGYYSQGTCFKGAQLGLKLRMALGFFL